MACYRDIFTFFIEINKVDFFQHHINCVTSFVNKVGYKVSFPPGTQTGTSFAMAAVLFSRPAAGIQVH
jgi:hypothetical protein